MTTNDEGSPQQTALKERKRTAMNNVSDFRPNVKPTTTLSRQEWLEQAAAAVRWLRKDSKPSSDEKDEYYAENCLWKAAEGRARSEKMPRQLVVTVCENGGGVRILDKDERAFIVELPDFYEDKDTFSKPRCWNPWELANHVFPGEKEEADNA